MGKSYRAEKSFSHLEDGNNRSASRKSSGKGSKMNHSRRNSSYFDDNDSLSSLDAIVPARFLNKLNH